MGTKSDKINSAMKLAREKAQAAEEKRRQNLIKRTPWRALAEDWQEELWGVYGMDVKLSPWNAKEISLARRLVTEVGYEMAVKMAKLFVQEWHGSGLPPFSFLWTDRASVLAKAKGQALTKIRRGVRSGEYNSESADRQPDIGWPDSA